MKYPIAVTCMLSLSLPALAASDAERKDCSASNLLV
jgi:hypothetical protein